MIKSIVLISIVFSLSGCSYIPSLVIYNSANEPIEICKLVLNETECVTIDSKKEKKIRLVSNQSGALKYSVKKDNELKIYVFNLSTNFNYFSEQYCGKLNKSFCDVAIQYNENETIIWAGKNEKHPISKVPEQPLGFPIKPNA